MQIEYQEPVHQSGRRLLAAHARSSSRRATIRRRWCRPSTSRGAGGWGERQRPGARSRPHRAAGARPARRAADQSGRHHGAAAGRLSARRGRRATITPSTSRRRRDDARVITLGRQVVPADRDFELTWTPAATAAPSVGLFREHVGDADYLLAFVTPPALGRRDRSSRARARSSSSSTIPARWAAPRSRRPRRACSTRSAG